MNNSGSWMTQLTMPTLAKISESLYNRLRQAGIDEHEARREVELIIEHATTLPVAKQMLLAQEPVAPLALEQIMQIADLRSQRIPLQYCLGHTYFMGLRFNVRPGVLIPRADTETLVEATLAKLQNLTSPLILDVGTGSGAIAISLARVRSDLRAVAIDISPQALVIARENAELNGVAERVTFIRADFLVFSTDLQFQAIISNPPYIPKALEPELAAEVAVHEPPEAIFGLDEDGLGFYRCLSRTANALIVEGGSLLVEVGQGQTQEVTRIFGAAGWQNMQIYTDLNKIQRVVSATCSRQPS